MKVFYESVHSRIEESYHNILQRSSSVIFSYERSHAPPHHVPKREGGLFRTSTQENTSPFPEHPHSTNIISYDVIMFFVPPTSFSCP
jgi:hypothetical protein